MIVKLLTEHHLAFLSLKEGCRGLYESTHVKMSICWKSHAPAQVTHKINLDQSAPARSRQISVYIDPKVPHTHVSYAIQQ